MKKTVYACWILWVIACIILKIMGASWTIALSCVWFPLLFTVSMGAIIFAVSDIGSWLKKRQELKIPATCENCLFKKACDIVNNHKQDGEEKEVCMGEKFGAPIVDGKCAYYTKG